MVVPGAMATRTADEIANMDADELREYLKSIEEKNKAAMEALDRERATRVTAEYNLTQQRLQSQQSTSGSGPSTGGGGGVSTAGSGQTIMMVQGKHSQPPSLNEATSFDVWLKRFNLWKRNCGYDDDKIGSLLIESLGNNSNLKKGLADKFFKKYTEEQMYGPGCLEVIEAFLKKELAENDIQKAITRWNEFEECVIENGELVETFIDRFDTSFTAMAAANPGLKMTGEIKAFMLMKRSKVIGLERTMVQSRLDFTKKDTLYEQTETALKEVLGQGPNKQAKQDEAFVAVPEGDECMIIKGKKWVPETREKVKKSKKRKFKQAGSEDKQEEGKKNRTGADGKTLKCFHCNSEYHLAPRCKSKKKKDSESSSDEVLLTQENDYLLAAGQVKSFTWECRGAAALDSCCTSNVAGESWLKMYLEELDEENLKKVETFPSSRTFGFGNNESLTANVSYRIPVLMAGKRKKLDIDIIKSDIPLLLSKKTMEKIGTKLDFENKTITMFGNTVEMLETRSGHPIIKIQPDNNDQVLLVSTQVQTHEEQVKMLDKLHRQFGHMTKKKFLQFLKTSSFQWLDSVNEDVQNIVSKCEGCILKRRNPDIPAVALPMATRFNEKVAMDLKHWGKQYICYFVDMWSGYTQGVIINSKKPAKVVNAFMSKWVSVYGVPKAVLHDLGGEFTGQEFKEMADILNVKDMSTAGFAPWSNGYCEKHHAVTDAVLKSLVRDFPKHSLDVMLSWACMVKNTAYLKNGFSPNQLVFGAGLNLPNVLDDSPSGLREVPQSETFASHLNSLNAARISFNRSIADSKIKVALKKKVRTNNTVFYPGDDVYFKRHHEENWKRGKVLQIDNKLIWIRNGGNLARVSPNMVIKAPFLFNDNAQEIPLQNRFAVLDQEERVTQAVNEEVEEMILEWEGDEENPFQVQENTPQHVEVGDEVEEPPIIEDLTQDIPEVINNVNDEQDNVANGAVPVVEENLQDNTGADDVPEDEDPQDEVAPVNRKRRLEVDNARVVRQRRVPNIQAKIHLKPKDQIIVNVEGEEVRTSVKNRCKVTGQYYNHFNVTDALGSQICVDLERNDWRRVEAENEEVLMNIIPQHLQSNDECMKAKQVELEKLNKFDAVTEVEDSGQFRISCRWVLWNKKHSDNSSEVRARLVARGYEVEEEVPSDSPTADQMNLRLLLGIAAANKWKLTSCDVKSAFLQGLKLKREVLMQPPPEANVKPGILWKLNVALYGLDEASLQFHFKCKEVFQKLGLKQSKNDPALFYKQDKSGKLVLLLITHVDDFLLGAEEKYRKDFLKKLSKEFEMGREECWNFKYCGYRIIQSQDTFEVTISQNDFAEETQIPKVSPARSKQPDSPLSVKEKSTLRGIAGKVGWLARGTRPDLLFSQLETSTKFGNPTVRDLKQAVKKMNKVKMHDSVVAVRSLGDDVGTWSISVASDASWKNLNDGTGSTQAGVIFLTNGEVKYPVLWWANKIRRTCISASEAELLSLIVAIDNAIYLRQTLEELFSLDTKVPVVVELDNSDVHQTIHANVAPKERRLRAEVARIRDSLNDGDIKEIVLVKGENQIADCMTKANAKSDDILQIFQSGELE